LLFRADVEVVGICFKMFMEGQKKTMKNSDRIAGLWNKI
jgi:hypothetical protein